MERLARLCLFVGVAICSGVPVVCAWAYVPWAAFAALFAIAIVGAAVSVSMGVGLVAIGGEAVVAWFAPPKEE